MGYMLANSLAIPDEVFLYILECSGTFRVMVWRKTMHHLGTNSIHMSLYFAVIINEAIVVFGANITE